MTYDDLMAAPLFGANRHVFDCDECKRPDKWAAYEMFGDMRGPTQEEVDAFNKMLADMSIPFHATVDDIVAVAERMERQEQTKCDEYVVGYPRVTSEDLTANHAAGLPVTRERIVRCEDCEFYQRNSRCGGALQCLNERFSYGKWGVIVKPDFFCADGKPREAE